MHEMHLIQIIFGFVSLSGQVEVFKLFNNFTFSDGINFYFILFSYYELIDSITPIVDFVIFYKYFNGNMHCEILLWHPLHMNIVKNNFLLIYS